MVCCIYVITLFNETFGKAALSNFLRFSRFLNEADGLSLIKRRIEFVLTIATRAGAQ